VPLPQGPGEQRPPSSTACSSNKLPREFLSEAEMAGQAGDGRQGRPVRCPQQQAGGGTRLSTGAGGSGNHGGGDSPPGADNKAAAGADNKAAAGADKAAAGADN
jgi:hypothetical protein